MTQDEETLVFVLNSIRDPNKIAIILQTYIQEHGPLSEDGASEVRKLINERRLKIDL